MKRVCRICLGICILVFVLGGLVRLLAADYDGNQSMRGFYALEKNTVDIMFYGSSHIYAGIDVAQLWDDYGIAAYDLAGTMQTLWNTYYNMTESLKTQTPDMMVVDLYGALIEDDYGESTNVIKNVSSMRFSANKIQNLWSSVPHEQFLTYLFSYPLTHTGYKYLEQEDYQKEETIRKQYYKGFSPSFAVTAFEDLPKVDPDGEQKAPSEKNRVYLEKIVQLAKEKDIPLSFIVVPYQGIQEEQEAIYRWIKTYAKQNGVLFLDGNLCLEQMGLDPKTDYAEESHLNDSGAEKFTRYLISFLTDSYSFADHRGDEKYDSWQKYSEDWADRQRDRSLQQCGNLTEYIGILQQSGAYRIYAALDDHYRENEYAAELESLLGIAPGELGYDCILVAENGKLLYQSPDAPDFLWFQETDTHDIAAVRRYGEDLAILADSQKCNDNDNDVTILVYNKKRDVISDVIAFNRDGVLHR